LSKIIAVSNCSEAEEYGQNMIRSLDYLVGLNLPLFSSIASSKIVHKVILTPNDLGRKFGYL